MTAAPLRLLHLGWADIAAQQHQGSGANLATGELLAELARRGHAVTYLRSGIDYDLRPRALGGLRIRRRRSSREHAAWRGIDRYDVINSPNLASANFNLRNLADQIDHPRQRALVAAFARSCRPDAIHIHSLEGFPLSIVRELRRLGVPIFITPHNYYACCPQVDLLQHERRICLDFDGGASCPTCLWHAPDPREERTIRRVRLTVLGTLGQTLGRPIAREFERAWRSPMHPPHEPTASPSIPALEIQDEGTNQRLLESRAHLVVRSEGGRRREAAIDALNAADLVLSPSRFLIDVHAAMGLPRPRCRHVPLGLPHVDALSSVGTTRPDGTWNPSQTDRPLVLGYFGNCYPLKGLATIAHAMLALDDATRARIRLRIHASGDDHPFRALLAGVPTATFHGSYDITDLPRLMTDVDVGLFPNAALENAPIIVREFHAMGVPVLASHLGASPEWVVPGSGWLVRANDPQAWAHAITELVAGARAIPSPGEVRSAAPGRTFRAYADEIESIYREFRDASRREPSRETITKPR